MVGLARPRVERAKNPSVGMHLAKHPSRKQIERHMGAVPASRARPRVSVHKQRQAGAGHRLSVTVSRLKPEPFSRAAIALPLTVALTTTVA